MNPYTTPYPRRRRRRRRKHYGGLLLVLSVIVLCAVGRPLWKGIQDIVNAVTPSFEAPTIATIDAQPTADTAPPVLSGVCDLEVYAGDTISYLGRITATDDCDPAPSVTVDSSQVDLSTPGTYEVVYTAADASGNTSRTAAMVTVLEKQAGFIDMETVYAAADEKLEELLWEGTPAQEQVYTIYRWARNSMHYGGHSDRTDWRQTAYTMLTDGRGDCYGYFAVTKLLLERLGIPTIDIVKVKNSEKDSAHFWSLVSIDGGESWYHFDATPRYGDGDNFCLVTDAFLDAYSEEHNNSHNRDKSLYPATPEDAL